MTKLAFSRHSSTPRFNQVIRENSTALCYSMAIKVQQPCKWNMSKNVTNHTQELNIPATVCWPATLETVKPPCACIRVTLTWVKSRSWLLFWSVTLRTLSKGGCMSKEWAFGGWQTWVGAVLALLSSALQFSHLWNGQLHLSFKWINWNSGFKRSPPWASSGHLFGQGVCVSLQIPTHHLGIGGHLSRGHPAFPSGSFLKLITVFCYYDF